MEEILVFYFNINNNRGGKTPHLKQIIMKTATKNIVLTKKGETSKNVLNAIDHCWYDEKNGKIMTGYYSGSGRFTTRHSAQGTICSILRAQGYKYTTGNHSDRGGANGEFVKVFSKVAMNFIKSIK